MKVEFKFNIGERVVNTDTKIEGVVNGLFVTDSGALRVSIVHPTSNGAKDHWGPETSFVLLPPDAPPA